MDALVKKRSTIKAQLTRFGQFLDNSVNSPNYLDELRVRLPKAEQLIDKFEDIQQDIELEDTSDAQQVERETFESNYYKTIGKAKSFTNYNLEDIPIQIKNVDQRPGSKLHLPVLNLPSFDGSFDDWFPFSDMFTVMIHNNESLTDIEKLHYLKSCLKKEAFNVISSLELTSTNYEVAWTLLQERYNNKTLIIQKHVHSLFNLPKLDKESVQSLRELINSSTKHIHALKALGEPTDNWDTLLIHLISSKFDHLTFRDWQDTLSPNKLPTMQDLNDFLNHRFHILDTVYYSSKRSSGIVPFPKHNDNNVVKHKDNVLPNKLWTSSRQPCLLTYDPKCELCQSSHLLFQCEHFLNLSVPDKISKVRSLNLCTNCLKCHQTNQCRSKSGCKTCGKRHNTFLCLRSVSVTKDNCVQSNSQPHTPLEDNKQVLSVGSTANLHTSSTQTILSTAIVDIISSSGKIVSCKALLDCGSQSNFISESLCKRLQLNKRQTAVSITGINCTATLVNYIVNATVKSRVSQFNAHMEFLVLSKLTEKLPGNVLVDYSKKVPSNVSLADPSYHIPSKIDMILGAQVFWDVLCNETIKLSVNGPSLRETKLGWIFTGNNEVSKQISDSSQTYFVSSVDSLNSNIQRFWELEDCQSQTPLTGDDLLCEQHYQTTTMRDSNGRYIVKIPLKEDVSVLGDSKSMAIKRFASLESKLDKNPKLYNDYRDFMLEYENLGHMKFIGELNSVVPLEDSISKFIPHHAVIKESSTTTKLRVIFDASAKSSNGLSLNDISMNGPRVQDELFSIISRFRMHKYVFTADIEKMYRQIQIDSSQCSMQSILWRSHKSVPLKIFQLNTVTYGTKSAPFLASRTLQQLALDESQNFPIAHKSLLNDFYVDDVLSGAHTIESALHLQKELIELLKRGGFHLRKWSSNHVDLLANIPHSDIQAQPLHNFDMNSPIVKTLGLMWDTAQDVFKYSVSQDIQCHNITKRQVLSEIAKIFDPLGLIGPVILSAKLIMQKLWRENLDWNDDLPSQLNNQWCDFYTSLTQLNELSINRYALSSNKPSSIGLHGFCDGSMAAYGACVYLRCQEKKGQINVTLISSKSRVAPLKVISLPRLELCAALVLCQLTQVLIKALNIDVNNVYYYSDSTIVLSWINSPSSHYNTFVANRVATIQSLTDSRHWNHVAGTENPADLVSRGCLVQPLLSSTLWWNGPQWLSEEHQFWKEGSNFQPDTNVTSQPELRKTVSSASRSVWPAMPQDQRRKSSEDYDAINPDFPPPSLKAAQNDSGRDPEKRKKKEKKWSIGGFFRRKKKISDTDSSSPVEDEEEKKGFLERRKAARKRRNRGSKDVTGSFEHVIINPPSRLNVETTSSERSRSREISSDRLVGRSQESLSKRQQDLSHIRGSSVSLEGAGRKGGRIQVKARVEASRDRLKADSSSDEGGGSSRHSSSSVQRLKSDENMGSKDSSLNRKSRAARTERYKKRLSRDDESLRDFQVAPPSRISRSDERLSNKRAEKVPPNNRWTAKVVYYESSDYDTKYTAITKSATPSPIQSPKARPKNSLHYTASAPSASNYVTYPPSHVREGVAGSHQELRSQNYPPVVPSSLHKPNQRYTDITPPRLPKSNSDMISKVPFSSSTQKQYPSWGQDVLNRKSASYDCNVNNLHFINNQISQPHPTEENVLVVQFPISRPVQKNDTKVNKLGTTPQQLLKQPHPPPPPPRDPHRRLVPSNGYSHESSPRPMSYAFEDRNQQQTRYQAYPEFGSSVSAFQRVPQTTPIDFQPVPVINQHHRSSSDHQIPARMYSVKSSPPVSRRPSSVQPETINKPSAITDSYASSPPSDLSQTGVPHHYQYYTDQQPRSRKPIHIAYQNQKPPNDPYLSDSQVVIKPPFQQTPRARPLGVQNATEFWKQKDQENAKKVHLSDGSPKLMQRHLLNVNTANERSRSNSPRIDGNLVKSKLKLPPLIMPVRGTESSGSLSSQSSPRDIPSPRTPSSKKLVHNEIGIPVFESPDLNSVSKREYRPLSMLEEKQESSEQDTSPMREKVINPPPPPTRRDSKVNAVTNFEHFDIFSDDNDLKDERRKSTNLEEALNELEAIYKSLRLGEEGYLEKVAKEQAVYENNRLDPSNWNAWVQSRGFESDSSFNYSRSSLESVDSIDSPIRRSNVRRSGVPDRVNDDMAYRRLNKKDRPPPQEQEVISQVGSFLLVSPTLSPPPFIEPPPVPTVKNEPDVTLDDVVYRNIKHTQNTLKISDPQPLFGIPLGPITPAPNSDYLHATPKETYRPTFKPRKIPDIVTDDLAFRNLRKDNNKEPLFTPEDTTLIDSPTLKKKRAVRSLSANLLSIIQKESMSSNNNNKLMYNNNNIGLQNDLEKSQSFTDVIDAINISDSSSKEKLLEHRKLGDLNSKKNLSGDDSDATPRASRHFPAGTSSPLIATSTETLTGSKNSLFTQESRPTSQKTSQSSSPRISLTPERRHTTDSINIFSRKSVSPAKHVPFKSESFKSTFSASQPKVLSTEFQRSPTTDNHSFTPHKIDKQEKQSPVVYDKTESDLLAILAREAKEASEQLSKELNDLNFDKNSNIEAHHSTNDILTHTAEKQEASNMKESPTHLHSKPLPIGKIIPHKPVKLNTFYITEDNKLENKQTVVTNKPVDIEGSKSMTDLLKELTKSLDFDFGTSPKSDEIQIVPEVKNTETSKENEEERQINETIQQKIFSETNEPRIDLTDSKDSEEMFFSSHEEVPGNLSSPERSVLSPFREVPVEPDKIVRTVSPVTNSFPLEIPGDDEPKPEILEVRQPHLTTPPGGVEVCQPDDSLDSPRSGGLNPTSRGQGGCSMDCSSLADEGTKSVSRVVVDPSTLLLVCMACAHQLAGLDFLTILGLVLAMASLILFLIL